MKSSKNEDWIDKNKARRIFILSCRQLTTVTTEFEIIRESLCASWFCCSNPCTTNCQFPIISRCYYALLQSQGYYTEIPLKRPVYGHLAVCSTQYPVIQSFLSPEIVLSNRSHRFADVGTAMVILYSQPSLLADGGSIVHGIAALHLPTQRLPLLAPFYMAVLAVLASYRPWYTPFSPIAGLPLFSRFLIRLTSLTFCITNLCV